MTWSAVFFSVRTSYTENVRGLGSLNGPILASSSLLPINMLAILFRDSQFMNIFFKP